MRCLYCNKKLSLLKLAKGDSYCNSEHFDAHQLQLSKTAFDRLMNTPAEEGPKAPLITKKPEPDEIAPAARLQPKAAPPPPAPEQAAAARLGISQPPPPSPPYAPFAVEAPGSYPPNPPVPVQALQPGEQLASAGELSLPIHEWKATVGLLNLYARLNFVHNAPLNWTSPRNFLLAVEGFPIDVVRPALIATPVETVEPVEQEQEPVAPIAPVEAITIEAAPVETVLPAEAAVSEVAAIDVEPIGSEEPAAPIVPVEAAPIEVVRPALVAKQEVAATRLAYIVAPSFLARTTSEEALDASVPVPNPMYNPALNPGPQQSAVPGAVSRPTRFARGASFKAQNAGASWVHSTAELPAQVSVAFPEEQNNQRERWHASSPLAGLTGSLLETERQAMRALEFAAPAAESLQVRPGAALLSRPDPARLWSDKSGISRTLSPVTSLSVTGSSTFGNFIAASEPPGVIAPRVPGARLPRTRVINRAPLVPAPVETRPFGQEPALPEVSLAAMELGLRATLGNFARPEPPVSTAAWQHHTHYRLVGTIAEGTELPAVPIELLPYQLAYTPPRPGRVEARSPVELGYCAMARPASDCKVFFAGEPAPSTGPAMQLGVAQQDGFKATVLRQTALPIERGPYSTVASTVGAELVSRCFPSTSLLEALPLQAGKARVSLCSAWVRWEPRVSAFPNLGMARFLPVREGAVLPPPVDWALVKSLPR